MKIAIPNPVRIDGELVAAASLEGTELPGGMSAFELAQQIGISSRKTEQNIARLKELRLPERIGPARGGYWEVLK